MFAGKYLIMIGDTIHLDIDQLKKDFKPRQDAVISLSKPEYLKVKDDIISFDVDAFKRDLEPRN